MTTKAEKEYIVIVLYPKGSERHFICVLKCEYYTILRYAETLRFSDEVEFWFFEIDQLCELEKLNTLSSHDAVNNIDMNKDIALSDFRENLVKLMDKLEVKKEKEEEQT